MTAPPTIPKNPPPTPISAPAATLAAVPTAPADPAISPPSATDFARPSLLQVLPV